MNELLAWQAGYGILAFGLVVMTTIVCFDSAKMTRLRKYRVMTDNKGSYTFTPKEDIVNAR